MKSKLTKSGIVVILLIVLIPLILYFNHQGAKESVLRNQETVTKSVHKESETVKRNTSASVKKEMENGTTEEKTAIKAAEENMDAVTPVNNAAAAVSSEKTELQHEFTVVIDPGHQTHANLEQEPIGPGAGETKDKVTGGTSGVATGKPEYKLTLEASIVLGDLLKSRGLKVIYTRTVNEVNLSNRERAEIANQNNADLFVRIHADGSTDRNVHGLSVLTPAQNSSYTKPIFADSLKASQFIIDETTKNNAVKVNGISYRGDMSGFNWSKVPCTLVEMGYMTNPAEDQNMSDPVYQKNLLTNIADGIMDYANYKK
jgi:N-acetylmuramoyl-L-alanine amidase